MAKLDDIRRQQLLREAEGYLDLIMGLADRWPLNPAVRDCIARRALDTLAPLSKVRKQRALVHYLRGQAFRVMEDYQHAVKPLEKAVALDSEDYRVHLALGWCYKRVGRLDLAIQVLEDALGVAPEQAIIHYNLACYWSLAHNTSRALRYLVHSFELEPSFRDLVACESDFDPIREDPDFRMLTSVVV